MSLLSSSIIRRLGEEEADHNMLQDLQLAAELGKTLLDRNKELETNLKTHQATIDEQAQEIEYMKKQTAALREVNDSRLKVYEQLEVSIQDLERANHRLVVENTADKKLIKSQCLTIENLEAKLDELQKKLDELKHQHDNLMRQQQNSNQPTDTQSSTTWKGTISQDGGIQQSAARSPSKSSPVPLTDGIRVTTNTSNADEEVTELLRQLQETRNQRAREQKRVNELREQLETLLKENNSLEDQLNEWRNKAQDMKNLQEEINTLEEVRQGKLCGRCLRGCDTRTHDELSIMLDQEEDDDLSIAESSLNDSHRESDVVVQEPTPANGLSPEMDVNPYRVLVEKYEALLEVQRQPARRKPSIPTPCMSLQEELEMSGDFNSFQTQPSDDNPELNDPSKQNGTSFRSRDCRNGKKPFSATPTDFSEAETSSSGFSDETSNKGTQTEGRPGSFLCSIADDDCKFSIYDDTSSFESRFNKAPEYRQLFREIFGVLKRAAEAKDEGEKLPLLDNTTQSSENRTLDDSGENDDTMSVMSSVISSVVSEPVIRIQTPTPEKGEEGKTGGSAGKSEHHVTRHPHKRHQQYDYLSVQVRKKNTAKKSAQKKLNFNDRSTTPDIVPSQNPKFLQAKSNSGGRRQKFRPLTQAEQDGTVWNGNTIHVFSSRTRESPTSRRINGHNRHNDQHNSTTLDYSREYKPSSASEEVARLRRLEMSYAEALRMPNKPKANHSRRH
ncbi:cerebellar degeneration-related protein 2 isoform X2 [Diachasma alloeum]|uniref:cerebellar degeneration-related protein 2 isoform X2 n=1 Tax=Diachasma alloeum TaxID=454923 RepID=UPI000738404B|nr:cerebellar degeneration-related protein 2 isoform X2 [Diachasma alloeum]